MQTVTNRSCFRSIFRIRSPPLTGGPRARHRRRERFPMEDRLLNVVRNCASSSALEVAGSLRAALERNKLSLHGGRWRLPHRVFPSLPGGGYTNVTECGASGFAPVRGGHHVLRAIGLRGGFLLQRWQHFSVRRLQQEADIRPGGGGPVPRGVPRGWIFRGDDLMPRVLR